MLDALAANLFLGLRIDGRALGQNLAQKTFASISQSIANLLSPAMEFRRLS